MNVLFIKLLLLISLAIGLSTPIFADIKPPNYDFTLASLEPFLPGGNLDKTKNDKSIQSDIFEDNGNLKIIKLRLKRANYHLDVYVQTKDDKITDMYVRLPQHFIHDIFLADLQKKYKKQDKYVQKDMNALYVWLNRDSNNIIYQGSCSITCFPMFVEIVSDDKTVIPFYKKFNEALPKW